MEMSAARDKRQSDPGREKRQSDLVWDKTKSDPGRDKSQSSPGWDKSQSDPGRDQRQSDPGCDKNHQSDPGWDKNHQSDPGWDKNLSDPGRDKSKSDPGRDKSQSDAGRDKSQSDPGRDKSQSDPGRDKSQSDLGWDTNAQIKQAHAGGFKKVCRIEEDSVCPFPGLASDVLEMRVKEGSKIRNLMGFSMTRMQDGQTGLRQVVFSGSGRAVTKTITCAEIMKRKIAGLHQITKLQYKGLREIWESQEEGDSEMTIHRTLPSIRILLSKDPLDPLEPGYQPPALWGPGPAGEASPAPEKRDLESSDCLTEPLVKRVCV